MKKIFAIFLFVWFLIGFAQSKQSSVEIDSTEVASASDEISPPNEYNRDDYERINLFYSDILVKKNADLIVTETITANVRGYSIQRGIFRAFPTIRNINGRKEKVNYKILSIKRDGLKEPYHTKTQDGVFTIYIGSKDVYLTYGQHTFEIKYQTQDQIGYFEKLDEIYWNVNGTDWDLPVDSISARITLPEGASIEQNACYKGIQGSTNRNCNSRLLANNVIEFSTSYLRQHENLTVGVGFTKGIVSQPSGLERFFKRNWIGFPLFSAIIFMLIFYYRNWRKFGKDPEKPVVYPQYDVPNNLSPASIGFIHNKGFDNALVTATLVNLTIKGYVTLKEKSKPGEFNKSYEITRTSKEENNLPAEESELLGRLFAEKKSVIIDGEYDAKIARAVSEFQGILEKKYERNIIENRNNRLVSRAVWIILSIFIGAMFYASASINDFSILGIGVLLLIVNGLITTIAVMFWEAKSLGGVIATLVFTAAFFIPTIIFAFFPGDNLPSLASHSYKFLIFGIISIVAFRYLINQPIVENVKLKSLIDGFKMYLGTAEEHLIQFHNPPEMTKAVFEKFLPYAIVFGVEDIWGKKFKTALESSLEEPELSPYFTDRQNSFDQAFSLSMTNAISDSSHYPYTSSSSDSSSSSSSSSYSGGSSSSGSSGGGSSGGGGGGGGGW